jgi:hypothetical protein
LSKSHPNAKSPDVPGAVDIATAMTNVSPNSADADQVMVDLRGRGTNPNPDNCTEINVSIEPTINSDHSRQTSQYCSDCTEETIPWN